MQIRCERTLRAFKWKYVWELGSFWLWAAVVAPSKVQQWQTLSAISFFKHSLVSALLHFSRVSSFLSSASDAFTNRGFTSEIFIQICWRHWCLFPFVQPHVLCAYYSNGLFGRPAFGFKCSWVTFMLDGNILNLFALILGHRSSRFNICCCYKRSNHNSNCW